MSHFFAPQPEESMWRKLWASRLWAVLAPAGNHAKAIGVEVAPKRNRHGEPPSFATLNQICTASGILARVTLSEIGY